MTSQGSSLIDFTLIISCSTIYPLDIKHTRSLSQQVRPLQDPSYLCLSVLISKVYVSQIKQVSFSKILRLNIPSGHMTLKKRQVLVEFWSLRHLTLKQRHSDVRFITSYIRPIRYIISTLYSDIVSTNQLTTSC